MQCEDSVPTQCKEATVLYRRIDSIINLIPQDHEGREVIVGQLKSRQESIRLTHPRAIDRRWNEVAEILSLGLPKPDEASWAKAIEELLCSPFDVFPPTS